MINIQISHGSNIIIVISFSALSVQTLIRYKKPIKGIIYSYVKDLLIQPKHHRYTINAGMCTFTPVLLDTP